MKRKLSRVLTMGLVLAIMLMMCAPVFAAGLYSETIGGDTKTVSFNKYLVMKQEANVPNITYTYTVAAGTAVPAADGKLAVLAGVDADKVTMEGVDTDTAKTIAFKTSDTPSTGTNAAIAGYDSATQKYVQKQATLDFSDVKFTEPGIYRYTLTEVGTSETRIIDVYVEDASDDAGLKLNIANIVLHTSDDADTDAKDTGFSSVYGTANLTFRKEVDGNQASKDKYFKFHVKIENVTAGTTFTVDLTSAENAAGTNDATTVSGTNAQSLTVAEGQTGVEADFYLRHGQEITIQGLPAGATYTVTEEREDYTSEAAAIDGYKDATNGTIESADIKTSYLNSRTGTVPTGILLTIAPFVLLMAAGILGAAVILGKKKTA